VTAECAGNGRIVKGLGHGYMLAFPEARDAVETAWRVIERRRCGPGPGVHASLHQGVAVVRDGDYFGTVVNIAARLLAAARRDELTTTSAVAEATGAEFSWENAGSSHIRGVSGSVDLYRVVGPRRPT
jgi:adenylate cyclase